MTRTLALALFLLAAAARAQPPVAEEDPHAAIARFFTALTKNDLAAARDAAVVRPADAPLLGAMGGWYAAQGEFHDAFKTLTGVDPTAALSIRTGVAKFMPNGELLVSADGSAAHCFWGDVPLRKIDGRWRFDLAEYDRTHALTEQLDLLRAEPAFWRDAAARLKAEHVTKGWEAEHRVGELRADFLKPFDDTVDAADRVRAARCFADLQGGWRVTIAAASEGADPKFDQGTATLTVKDKTLTVDASERSLNGAARLDFESFQVCSAAREGDLVRAEWSAVFQRPLGQLRGTLFVPGPGTGSVYTVIGTRLP